MAISREQPLRPYVQALGDAIDSYDIISAGAVDAFGTVAQMQAATYLTDGMVCHTNGFHSEGDGGAAYYMVSASGTANGMDVLALQGGLYATLVITETYVTPEQFGAYGDGLHDDSDSVIACLSGAFDVELGFQKTYNIKSSAIVRIEGNLKGNFSTIADVSAVEGDSVNLFPQSDTHISDLIYVGSKDNYTATSEYHHAFALSSVENVVMENCTVSKAWGDGIDIYGATDNVRIVGCIIDNNGRNGVSLTSGTNIIFSDCTIKNTSGFAPQAGFDVEPNTAFDNISCEIHNCKSYGNASYGWLFDCHNLGSSKKGNVVFDVLESDSYIGFNNCHVVGNMIIVKGEQPYFAFNTCSGVISECVNDSVGATNSQICCYLSNCSDLLLGRVYKLNEQGLGRPFIAENNQRTLVNEYVAPYRELSGSLLANPIINKGVCPDKIINNTDGSITVYTVGGIPHDVYYTATVSNLFSIMLYQPKNCVVRQAMKIANCSDNGLLRILGTQKVNGTDQNNWYIPANTEVVFIPAEDDKWHCFY